MHGIEGFFNNNSSNNSLDYVNKTIKATNGISIKYPIRLTLNRDEFLDEYKKNHPETQTARFLATY